MDPTVASEAVILKGLKPGGAVVLNTEHPLSHYEGRFAGFTLYCVPARRIALAHKLGSPASPMVNTAMVGAVCRIFDLADLESLEAAIRESVPSRADANVDAAVEAAMAVAGAQPCPS
jgi:Pyruvate/2-oxoacid:ferredoxin oxidoreductase gamma subunit